MKYRIYQDCGYYPQYNNPKVDGEEWKFFEKTHFIIGSRIGRGPVFFTNLKDARAFLDRESYVPPPPPPIIHPYP